MDMFLREAIGKYLSSDLVDDNILKTRERRQNFVKVYPSLCIQNGTLCYKGRTDEEPKVVPTPQQVDECLHGKHYRVVGKHLRDKQTLVKTLSSGGYSYPASLGGLAALVDE